MWTTAATHLSTTFCGSFVLSREKCEVLAVPCVLTVMMWFDFKRKMCICLMTGQNLIECNITTFLWLTAFGDTSGFLLSCEARLLHAHTHTHSTVDETPPDNLIIVHADLFWKGNNQWGQSNDLLTNPEVWSPHSLSHSATNASVRLAGLCGPASKS